MQLTNCWSSHSVLNGFPYWLICLIIILLASINHSPPPPRSHHSPGADGQCSFNQSFCWQSAFWALAQYPLPRAQLMPIGENSAGSVAAFLIVEAARFDWTKPAQNRKSDGKSFEEEDESFFFQMADVPPPRKSREKELQLKKGGTSKSKEAAKGRRAKSRERQTNSRSAERHRASLLSTSSPKLSQTTQKPMITTEERKRSASREIQQPKGINGGGGHNITLSSRHHKKGGGGQGGGGDGTKKLGSGGGGGGINKGPNWFELSSTEQSISMMLRCQDLETRELLPASFTCRNLRSDKVCNYLFHEIDRKTGRRDVKCNLQGLEDIAESCRKTCGICCEDINYACEDDKNGIIDCTRQLEKCHQKKWFGVLSRFCAGSCGLCAMTPCRDYDNSCRVRKALCLKPDSMDYMRENCARTCGFCVVGEEEEQNGKRKAGGGGGGGGEWPSGVGGGKPVISGKPVVIERPLSQHRLIVPECTDKAANCTTNAHLCGSPNYGEYMVKFCTKTCLKCGEPQPKGNGDGNGKSSKFPMPIPLEVVIQPLLGESGGDRRIARKCEDQSEKCGQWKAEGLCKLGDDANTKFTDDQRNKICPKTCGNCQ